MVVVIGPNWLPADPALPSRLDSRLDNVRIELETALAYGVPLFPVLLDDTAALESQRLPESIQALAYANAVRLRHDSWERDCGLLISALEDVLIRGPASPVAVPTDTAVEAATADRRTIRPRLIVALIGVLVVGAVGVSLLMSGRPHDGQSDPTGPAIVVPSVSRPAEVAFSTAQDGIVLSWNHAGGPAVTYQISDADTGAVLVDDLAETTYAFKAGELPDGSCVVVAAVLSIERGLNPIAYSDPVCR